MKPRNVIVLHTDQQRADSLLCMGNARARTPNIDRLAAEGSLFSRHIVSSPICSPSRASLLTGLYPPGHNLWCNGIPLNRSEHGGVERRYEKEYGDAEAGFRPEPLTMADMFGSAGYSTASFGKLHLTPNLGPEELGHQENLALWSKGAFNSWHGPYYGFQHVEMTLGHGEQPCHLGHYAQWLQREHSDVYRRVQQAAADHARDSDRADLYASMVPAALHHSAWLAERLCEYVAARANSVTPFFAFVGFPDPHHPFSPSYDVAAEFDAADVPAPTDSEGLGIAGSPFARIAQERLQGVPTETLRQIIRYTYAMVHQVDHAVGRILGLLDELGIADDTVVVFTSDHGDMLGDHGYLRKGFGASDRLLRVPLIIRGSGLGLPARVDRPVSNCDVMPTIAGLAGLDAPPGLHGRDLRHSLRRGEHHAMAFCSNGDMASVNHTIYDDRYRLTWYPEADWVELFDHDEDPCEQRNLGNVAEHRGKVEELRNALQRGLAQCYNPTLGRIGAW